MISEGQSSQAMDVKPSNSQPRYTADTNHGKSIKQQDLDIKNCVIIVSIKIVQVLLYFLLSQYKLVDFFLVTLIVSIDFQLCKNIFGKKLAGLRWWTQINMKTQQEQWIFQSCDPSVTIHKINYGIFWISNALIAVFWAINTLILLIVSELFWITISGFCLALYSINLICYYKCRGNHQKKLVSIMQKVGLKSAATLLMDHNEIRSDSHFQNKFQIE